jgi:rhomboid protease GluP
LKNKRIKQSLYNPYVRKPSYSLLSDNYEPVVTNTLCIICVVVFILDVFSGFLLTNKGMKVADDIINNGEVYRLFTSTVLHASLIHLLGNVIFIKYFGTRSEIYFGAKKYLLIVVASGFTGSLCSFAFTSENSLGASGIAFGLIGALLSVRYIMNPEERRKATRDCWLIVAVNLILGLFSTGTDNAAHVGGLIGGYTIGQAMGVYKEPERKKQKTIGVIAYCAINIFLAADAYYKFIPEFEFSWKQLLSLLKILFG